MTLPQATLKRDGSLELRFPFDRNLVEQLKVHVPAYGRTWDPLLKVWTVSPMWAATALGLLRTFFPDAKLTGDRQDPPTDPTPIRPFDDSYRTLYLQPNAPAYLVDVVYRALAREENPDRKPPAERDRAHERMIAINRAVEVLRAKVAS